MPEMSRVAVVSGATGGLGPAVVAGLLRAGWRVAVPYRDVGGFERLRTSLDAPEGLIGGTADLADPGSVEAFVEEATARLGRLGGEVLGPEDLAPAEDHHRMGAPRVGDARRDDLGIRFAVQRKRHEARRFGVRLAAFKQRFDEGRL